MLGICTGRISLNAGAAALFASDSQHEVVVVEVDGLGAGPAAVVTPSNTVDMVPAFVELPSRVPGTVILDGRHMARGVEAMSPLSLEVGLVSLRIHEAVTSPRPNTKESHSCFKVPRAPLLASFKANNSAGRHHRCVQELHPTLAAATDVPVGPPVSHQAAYSSGLSRP